MAADLVEHFGDRARLLPMDGFHLADDELTRRGSLSRKGAPDTFDVDGYVTALATRARHARAAVLVPRFDRHLEAAIAGSICIEPEVDLVVTDGNYLLLDADPWRAVAPLLDERWMLEIDDELRVERLVARHVAHGRSADAAAQVGRRGRRGQRRAGAADAAPAPTWSCGSAHDRARRGGRVAAARERGKIDVRPVSWPTNCTGSRS